jgi:UDP-glucose 4-epimerase
MRVLLTGATGFLGSRVLPLLAGHETLCLSRDPRQVPCGPGIRAIRGDLGDDGTWIDEVAAFEPEWCVHLAWEGLPDYSLRRCRENLAASLRLVDALAHARVRRMVVAGSCWEYGSITGAAREDSMPNGTNVFAAVKRALLTAVEAVARESSFAYRWARIFFVYGAGQRPQSLIPHLAAALRAGRAPDVRDPAAVQDFVHVDDVASALVALAAADVPSGVFNIGTGEPTSVGEVANLAAEHYGRPRFFDIPNDGRGVWADTHKMRTSIGWRPRFGIREGVAKTLAELDQAS